MPGVGMWGTPPARAVTFRAKPLLRHRLIEYTPLEQPGAVIDTFTVLSPELDRDAISEHGIV